jgi:hypothetical protein
MAQNKGLCDVCHSPQKIGIPTNRLSVKKNRPPKTISKLIHKLKQWLKWQNLSTRNNVIYINIYRRSFMEKYNMPLSS